MEVKWNRCQTPLEDLHLESYATEIQEQFWDFLNNVPFIRWLVSPNRPMISDLPRDEYGRAIIDVTKPPILEGSDYFRRTAIEWQDKGRYTMLRPNVNPNSEFGRWLMEEKRRGWEGLVNPDTGMWVTGDYYWMLNYCPMHMIKKSSSGLTQRVVMHPNFWDGQFFTTHYFYQARLHGHHAAELASRGKGKTSLGAAMLSKRFIIGEFGDNQQEIQCFVTAADRTKMMNPNQILTVFVDNIDFCAKNTQFDSRRLKSSNQEMSWKMGYNKSGSNIEFGSKNTVTGVITGVNQDKLNGSRGVLYLIEEAGIFKDLRSLYNMIRPSVEQGTDIFGEIISYGCVCAGTKVLDENGIERNIEDIALGDKLLGYDGEGVSTEDITYIQGEAYKECVRITTQKGGVLECSTDHPLLTLLQRAGKKSTHCAFYKAEELKAGMTLLIPKTISRFGNIHEDNAFLLGALFGDGNYSNHSCVSLSISSEEEYEYYNSHYDIGISKLSKGDNVYAQIYFKSLHPLLQKYKMDKQSFNRKNLPYNIDLWDKESLCEFLSGYFTADGNIQISHIKHRTIKLSCKYKVVLEQVKHLLHKIGITGHILKESKPARVLHSKVNLQEYQMSPSTLYVLYICTAKDILTFRENLHFLIKKKQERLDNYIAPKRPEGYYEELEFVYRDNHKGKFFVGKKLKDLKSVCIKNIEFIGKQRIYNLTANTTHTYLTNGFISSNTAGDDQSDFVDFAEMIYSPEGFNLEPLVNVYDKEGQGRRHITMFYPAYLNYDTSCIDKDGNSDVTRALLMICNDRYKVKYGTSDINTITKRISQYPVTPQEAIIRSQGNVFPVTELNERLNQIDNNPNEYDDVYVGELVQIGPSSDSPSATVAQGKYIHNGVQFKPTGDIPIRDFPTSDNKVLGALEIYSMPQTGSDGTVPYGRYLISCLKEGEKVNTSEGLKPVEAVTLQDKLINIEGEFVDIKNLQVYHNEKPVYTVKLFNIYNSTTFSDEHPIYCATPKLHYHHSMYAKKNHLPYRYFTYDFEFKKVKNLKVGDVVKSPNVYRKELPYLHYWKDDARIDRRIDNPLNQEDFWWLIGLIIGDGWATCNGYNIHISFNTKESCYIQKAKRIVNNLFGRSFTQLRHTGSCAEYSFCFQTLNTFIRTYIGCGAENKHISEWIKYLPLHLKKHLILGYLSSDGSVSNNKIEFVSTSLQLLKDVQDILFSLGIIGGISKMKKYACHKIQGRTIKTIKDKYHLRISKEQALKMKAWNAEDIKLAKIVPTDLVASHNYKRVWMSEDLKYIYFKVASIETADYVGNVYNFECDTHTFMCNYIPTHNCDPFDSDVAKTMSLGSVLVMDTWTDTLVAEYTGRPMFAEDLYEKVRLLCLFYNTQCMYENNLKGMFSYFSSHSSTHLLANTPEFLKERQMISTIGYGNAGKGIRATTPIINGAFKMINSWLRKPVVKIEKDAEGNDHEVSMPNLFHIRNRALLKELIQWNPYGNYDRVMSLVQLILYREEKMILYHGNLKQAENHSSGMEDDDYWTRNYPGNKENKSAAIMKRFADLRAMKVQ